MHMLRKSIVSVSLFTIISSVQATEGFYVGFNLGQASYDVTLSDLSVFDDGSISSASIDDGDTSFSLTLGYQLTPNIALEGGFIDLGELTANANSDGTGFLFAPGPVNFKVAVDGLFFDVKGLLPLNEQFSLYGKLGLLKWSEEGTLSDSTGSLSGDDDGTDIFFGVGASFNINHNISINADYSRYKVDEDEDNVDVLSVGIQYGF